MILAPRVAVPLLVLLLALPFSGKAGPDRAGSHASQRRVWQLPATGKWFEGQRFYRSETPLDRARPFGNGSNTVYLAQLEPGLDYTLGLRYPADAGHDLSVEFFDRWPFDPGAQRYKLPMGPVLRTDPDWIEYRWRVGVSGRSQGNLAFITLEAKPRGVARADRFRHFMYLVTPAVKPMNQLGTGITYLRGPSDLFLPQWTGQVQYVVEYPYGGRGPDSRPGEYQRSGRELIRNGDFHRGLQGWEMFSVGEDTSAEDHVAFGKEGLRIWSDEQAVRAGVRQTIQRDVQDVGSLTLGLDLRIDKDLGVSSHADKAAVELVICYLDTGGKDHCGDEAYRAGFTARRLARWADSTVLVKAGEWFHFEDELMDVDPRPQVIKSVTIAGGQDPGQDARIRQVNLTERGSLR